MTSSAGDRSRRHATAASVLTLITVVAGVLAVAALVMWRLRSPAGQRRR